MAGRTDRPKSLQEIADLAVEKWWSQDGTDPNRKALLRTLIEEALITQRDCCVERIERWAEEDCECEASECHRECADAIRRDR